jgi:hypothetical protein
MRCLFREVHSDYQLAKSVFANAKNKNEKGSISFYQIVCCNLEQEMKSFGDA